MTSRDRMQSKPAEGTPDAKKPLEPVGASQWFFADDDRPVEYRTVPKGSSIQQLHAKT